MTDWSSTTTTSPPDIISLKWIDDSVNPPQTKEINAPSTTSSDSHSTFQAFTYTDEQGKPATQDVLTTQINKVHKTRASVNPAHVQASLKKTGSPASGGVTLTTTTTYEYTVGTKGPVLIKETILEETTLYALAGKLGITQKMYEDHYSPSDELITNQKTIREYETITLASGREMTRTLTSQWTCAGSIPEGGRACANYIAALNPFVSVPGFDVGGKIAKAVLGYSELVFQGTTVEIGIGRAPVPTRPSNQDLIKDDVVNGNNKPLTDDTPTDRYGNTRNWPAFVLKALGDVAWQKYAKDSNNDGIPDWADFVPDDWTDYNTDSDGDGKPDWADFVPGPWANYQGDSNGDGKPDWADYVPVGWKDFSTADTDWTTTDKQVDNSKTVKGIVLFDSEPYDETNSTTTAIYEMGFAPDDHFEYVKGIRKLIPGAAEEAAKRFGLMESAIDVGHAYGQNIVTGWNEIPTLDMEPLYIRLAGVEGAFLMDSVSYAWGPDGMVVSSDLMLLGVSGYYGNAAPASSWLRLPFDPTQLQAAGALTTEASSVKANSITIPQGFDARDPGPALAQLPTNGADVFRQWRSGDRIMAPTLVWELLSVATGPLLIATEFEYALNAGSDVETPASGPVADFAWITRVDVPGPVAVMIAGIVPGVSTSAVSSVPLARVDVNAEPASVSTGTAVQVPFVGIAMNLLYPLLSLEVSVTAPCAQLSIAAALPTVTITELPAGTYRYWKFAEITSVGIAEISEWVLSADGARITSGTWTAVGSGLNLLNSAKMQDNDLGGYGAGSTPRAVQISEASSSAYLLYDHGSPVYCSGFRYAMTGTETLTQFVTGFKVYGSNDNQSFKFINSVTGLGGITPGSLISEKQFLAEVAIPTACSVSLISLAPVVRIEMPLQIPSANVSVDSLSPGFEAGYDASFASVQALWRFNSSTYDSFIGQWKTADSSSNNTDLILYGSANTSLVGPVQGSWLQVPQSVSSSSWAEAQSDSFVVGSDDYTIECYADYTSASDNTYLGLFWIHGNTTALALSRDLLGSWILKVGSSIYNLGIDARSHADFSHFALTRSGSVIRLFVDGQQVGGSIASSLFVDGNIITLGLHYQGVYARKSVYIDEFRLTVGTARYTSNFTPTYRRFPAGVPGGITLPTATVAVQSLAPMITTGSMVAVPATDVTVAALMPSVSTGGAAVMPAADIAIAALLPDVVTIGVDGDYFSNMATQQYSALRDWLVDWWGD